MENSIVSSPLILALDTSAGRSSVALWQEGVLAEAADEVDGQQSRTLVPLVEQVLGKAGKTYEACDLVACAVGPGGFTSVRVGVAAARAIALVSAKPMVGVNSLEVLAFSSEIQGDVVAVIDAHRQQFYAQRFRCLAGVVSELSPPMLVDEAGLRALAHGAKRVQGSWSANDVARLAQRQWATGRRDFPSEPLYIREPDAKLPA